MSKNSVRLDIGGKKFHTSIDTLTRCEPDSMLHVMFSGCHTLERDDRGYIFIDRDGKHFRHILNWLRDGVIPTLEDSGYCELLREAEYYQLVGLMHELNVRISEKSEELSSDLTRIEIIKWRPFNVDKQARIPLHGINLSGIDLSNLNLTEMDFTEARLKNVKFHGADLQGDSFANIDAQGVIFDKAKLNGCNFRNSNIRDASFIKARLTILINYKKKQLDDPNWFTVNFNNSILRNVKFDGAVIKAAFNNVDAQGVNFEDAIFTDCSFENSNIREASFCRAKLSGNSIDLRTAKFINCCFVGADLSCIKYLNGADFKGSDLRDANLGRWHIQDFNGAKL